jgi:hypothetical protein
MSESPPEARQIAEPDAQYASLPLIQLKRTGLAPELYCVGEPLKRSAAATNTGDHGFGFAAGFEATAMPRRYSGLHPGCAPGSRFAPQTLSAWFVGSTFAVKVLGPSPNQGRSPAGKGHCNGEA